MIKRILNIGLLQLILCLLIPVKTNAQENPELLSLYSLDTLTVWRIKKNRESGKWQAFNRFKMLEQNSFDQIEAATFITNNYESIDTLNIDPALFPHLKKLSFEGIFVDELLFVSQLKKIQHLDLRSLSQGDIHMFSYGIFFPDQFWELSQLQILEITASDLSDVSEKISRLGNLKILKIDNHKLQFGFFLPWSILLKENLLLFATLDPSYQQEKQLLDEVFPINFEQLPYNSNDLQTIHKNFGKVGLYLNGSKEFIKNDTLQLNGDSLTLTIPLSEDHITIHGTAYLEKSGSIVQEREYKYNLAHGKWILQNVSIYYHRTYENGSPSGNWKMRKFSPDSKKLYVHFNTRKSIVRCSMNRFFKVKVNQNFNDVLFFKQEQSN